MINCLLNCLIKFEYWPWWWCRKITEGKIIHKSDENYPKDALHMYAENEPAMKRNEAVLNDLLADFTE